MTKTYSAKPSDIEREWFIIDATDKPLGRVATEIARRLRGKHKPEYTPHMDTGDYIVVVNARNVAVTGNKRTQKTYYWHSGYPGGIKSRTFDKLIEEAPTRIIEKAVKGMLPKGPLGRQMFRKLKVYADEEGRERHQAQQPTDLSI